MLPRLVAVSQPVKVNPASKLLGGHARGMSGYVKPPHTPDLLARAKLFSSLLILSRVLSST